MSGWKIIDKDGLPDESGDYMLVSICYEYTGDKRTGRRIATVSATSFDEDDGFALTYDGYAYAWREIPSDLPEIPDGVVWGRASGE